MSKSTKVPALKNIPAKTERELKIALDSIKEALEVRLGRRGDPLDRAVTLRELSDAEIVKVNNKEVGVSGGISTPPGGGGDLTPPVAPSNLTAAGAFTSITLTWSTAGYGNHAYTEIWRSQANALGGATLLSTSNAFVYTDEVGYDQTYFYWVRYVSTSDVEGPWNDTEGTSATTAVNVGAVMNSLSENLSNLPGYSTLTGLITAANAEGAEAARVIKSSSAPTTRADGSAIQGNDIWYDTDDGQVHTRNSANNAWVAARDATLVNLYGSTSFTGSTVTGALATAQADIVTVTNAQSSTASSLSSLTSTVNTNTANIATEQTTRANADSALSTDITNLTSTVNKKNKTFLQTSAPANNTTNDLKTGDLWVDSDDDNKLYRWNGSSWAVVRDTANDGKATIFTQDDVPTSGVKAGDLWFDTNDSNRQYRAMADGSDQVTSGEWEEVRDVSSQAAIATEATTRANADSANATLITNLTSVVDLKNQTFISTSAPTAVAAGDLWVDSDDNNKLYRATGAGSSNWVAVRDTANDGKTTVFTQTGQPTANNTGDIWFDTDSSPANKQYRWDGSSWVEVRDVTTNAALTTEATTRANADSANATAITNLTATVDAKNQTFVQTSAPAAIAAGDLWIDSDDDNKLYRATAAGSSNWVAVRDTANDGKTTVFTQTSQPTAENTGDIWFDTDDSNKQYRWDGSSWVVVRDVITQAGVTTVQNAIANGTAAEAGYGVSVNANGAVAGMYIMANSSGDMQNNTSSTNIIFEANQVTIRDSNSGGTNVTPFSVLTTTDSDGNPPGVYITSALIKKASIEAAQIGTVNADTITTGSMSAARITSGTMDAARISGGVIQSTDLSTSGSTTIHGANITTGTIDAARIDASFIQSSDLGSSGSTTIDGSRITTGQIDAARINVTDLVLPAVHSKVTGTAIGGFANNQMRLAQVGSIGTEPGIYQGYVRIYGGTGQVKTLSFAIGDGTYSSTGELDSDNGVYTNGPNDTTLPMVDVGGIQYHSNRAEAWAGIARFQNQQAVAQLSVTFRKRSATSRTANLYVLAQGDGGTRYLDSVEYAFTRLAVNEPIPFTFTDQTGVNTNTVITSNTITLTGAGFTGGTASLSTASGNTAQFKVNNGSYQTGSATVTTGDTITLQLTSSSSVGTGKSCTFTCNNVSDTFSVTTAGGTPPGGTPPGSPPPLGPPTGPPGEAP